MDKNEIILQQVQRSYDWELELNKNYETKANYNIALCGVIIAVLLSSLSIIISNNIHISIISFWVTIFSILSLSYTLLYSFRVIRITDYRYVLADYDTVKPWKYSTEGDLINKIIYSYIFTTKVNRQRNFDKVKLLSQSQRGVILTIIIIGFNILFGLIGYIFF
jgi:hypothetical protein